MYHFALLFSHIISLLYLDVNEISHAKRLSTPNNKRAKNNTTNKTMPVFLSTV